MKQPDHSDPSKRGPICITCGVEMKLGEAWEEFNGDAHHGLTDECVRAAVAAEVDLAERYERALKAIKNCTLTGVDFGDWVQAVCEDVLDGMEAECWNCGTFVHEGPCVSGDGGEKEE